jgi:SWI/SNF-related matrix-associated actin-dependent regulator of chromatin subfamily A member 5
MKRERRAYRRLSLFAYLREKGVPGPFLVICPLSVLSPWMNEIKRWTPTFTSIRFHANMPERERLKQSCKDKEFDVYVTSYEQFVAERHWFGHRIWRYVVVDEGTS